MSEAQQEAQEQFDPQRLISDALFILIGYARSQIVENAPEGAKNIRAKFQMEIDLKDGTREMWELEASRKDDAAAEQPKTEDSEEG